MQLLAAVKDEIKSKLLSAKLTAAYEEFLSRPESGSPGAGRIKSNLYFTYIKSDSGVNENENKNLSGSDPLPGG